MVEWLEANPIIYDKKLRTYKDTALKERIWQDIANDIGKPVVLLKTWYASMRSRYGRLSKKKSGDGATQAEMTERDIWINRKFDFLRSHIYEVQKRTTVSVSQIILHVLQKLFAFLKFCNCVLSVIVRQHLSNF